MNIRYNMSYTNPEFTKHIPDTSSIIFEVGARDCLDSIELSKHYKNSTVYSFECNPLSIETCRSNLQGHDHIKFYNFGLGNEITKKKFFPYMAGNTGASSFFKRIDFKQTQIEVGEVEIDTLSNFCNVNNIDHIDILCMDTQGFELNILKGANEFIKNIHFIILEEPRQCPNRYYLPVGHSKYIGAPTSKEIKEYLNKYNFVEVVRTYENELEDNVMYKNTLYQSMA